MLSPNHRVGSDITISPSQAVNLGSNATFTCQHVANTSVSFLWYFLAANSSSSVAVVLIYGAKYHSSVQLNMNTLLIRNVTQSDFGWYYCDKLNPPSCLTGRSELTLFGKLLCTI